MATTTTSTPTWPADRRQAQSARMTQNMQARWARVHRNRESVAQESRSRSLYARQGHQLAVWMSDPNVGLTQDALGEKIGVSGMTISNWVSGRSRPKRRHVATLKDIAKEYPVELKMDWLHNS